MVALHSNVGLSALVKGRTSSYGLRPSLRQTGASVAAGCLYPSYRFAPTRWNPSDHPTCDREIPEPGLSAVRGCSFSELMDFAELGGLSRPAANWVRLSSLLLGGPFLWLASREEPPMSHSDIAQLEEDL